MMELWIIELAIVNTMVLSEYSVLYLSSAQTQLHEIMAQQYSVDLAMNWAIQRITSGEPVVILRRI